MSILHLLCYLSLAALVVAVAVRSLKLLRLPLHLRWELYPVMHDRKRAHYGGSYFEESEWWTKPRETSKLTELKFMVPEILLLAGVRHHNKSQWLRSFPFHFGLYLLIGTTVLLILGGLLNAVEPGGFFGTLIPILGYAGIGLALLGALSLLVRRAFNEEYREYTNPVDFFNLILFTVAMGVALLAFLTADQDFGDMRGFFAGLFRGGEAGLGTLQSIQVVLFCFLVFYVPLTHMSHFFTKWFMYHDIRWSDEPLEVGGKIEGQVGKALGYKPTWAAPHIDAADGSKTWVDVATSPAEPPAEDAEGGES
jgi:nitrate reductase gamma subunit